MDSEQKEIVYGSAYKLKTRDNPLDMHVWLHNASISTNEYYNEMQYYESSLSKNIGKDDIVIPLVTLKTRNFFGYPRILCLLVGKETLQIFSSHRTWQEVFELC